MDEHWLSDNAWVDPDDPAAIEREERRREREQRRRERDGNARPQPAKPADPVREPPADSTPPAPATSPPPAELPRSGGNSSPKGGGGLVGPRSGLRLAALLGLAVVALAVLWFTFSLTQPFHGEGGARINLTIPDGASVGDVGDQLAEEGVIDSSAFFQLRVTLAGKRSEIYPGNYSLAQDMSYSDAITAITTLPVERTITITIPEGLNREQVAAVVADAGLPGDYLGASAKPNAFKGFQPKQYGAGGAKTLEGFLFPATYELSADAGAKSLISHQLEAFKDRLAGINLRYARSKNLTVFDVVTIASMIEREVTIPKERRLVASVIYNRLRDGIALGIDATTRFAVGNFTEPLTQSELDSDSPYNTRKHLGLPPGPIGNPGEESIRAAARPARTDYLYYVVKPGTCGLHAFSSNDAQFQRDVAAYNEAREAAGGKSPTDCG